MLRLCTTLLALLLLTSGISAQSVQQSGSVTPGHAAMWSGTGIIKDAGTAASGNLSTLGVTNNGGAAICVNSDVVTAAGRNQLCFSATTNGGTKISSYIYGTATNAGIVFDINGSVQGFPAATLPVVSGNLACFDGTTGNIKACTAAPITGDVTFVGSNYFAGQFGLSGDITPTALSGNVNDYAPTGFVNATVIRQDGGAADRNITGLTGGADGRLVQIVNIGTTNNIVLVNQSASSTAADRFLLSADITLGINRSVVLRYDGTTTRWRLFTASTATASLGLNQVVIGGGPGADPFSIACASTATVLHGGSPPACSAIVGSDLPNPSVSTLGGVFSKAAVANTFVTGIDTSGNVLTGVVTLANPFSVGGVQYGANITSGANYNIVYAPDGRMALQLGGAGDLTNYSKATNGLVVTNNDGSVVFGSIISSGLRLNGATSGTLTLAGPAIAGANTLTFPAGTTNFSATGGTSQVVKQTSAGGAFTVAQLAASDLSNGTTGTVGTAVVLATSPALTTPDIGAATGTSLSVTASAGLTINTNTAPKLTLGAGGTAAAVVLATGNTGSISFQDSGGQMMILRGVASAVNYLDITGGSATGGSPSIQANGTDTDIALPFSSKGAGSINWYTSAFGALQVQFLHTASASRSLTLTGSNGGNPTIGASAGSVAISTGLIGSTFIQATTAYNISSKLAWSATAPSVSSGFCTSPSISANNGTAAFTITIGSACAASTGVLTMPTASTGWACHFNNVTTPASNTPYQTASTTTSVSITNYARTTGVASNWTASEVITAECTAY